MYPGVAQMVARLNGVQEAAGSNPVTRTKNDGNLEFFLNSRLFFVSTRRAVLLI